MSKHRSRRLLAVESPVDLFAPVDSRLFFELLALSIGLMIGLAIGYVFASVYFVTESLLLVITLLMLTLTGYVITMLLGRIARTNDLV